MIDLLVQGEVPLIVEPQFISAGITKFELLAVPFFILAAEIMNSGGLTKRIFGFALALVGWMRGGLAQVNVIASVVFAGISGTAVADAAGLGRVEVEAMRQAGYDTSFAAAVTLSSSVIGPLVPPSVVMIIYATTAEVSVGKMLLAGVVPGLLLAAILMGFIYWLARSGRVHCPTTPLPGGRDLTRTLVDGLPALFMRSDPSPKIIGRPDVHVAVLQTEKVDVPHCGSPPTLLAQLRATLLRLGAFTRQATRMACHPKPKAYGGGAGSLERTRLCRFPC